MANVAIPTEAIALMKAGAQFGKYDEAPHNWRKPTSLEPVFVSLDPESHLISIRSQDKSKFLSFIDIEFMTDVRTKPFTDESEDTLIAEPDWPRFLLISFYDEERFRDYVNVLFLNLLAEDVATATAWRQGLAYLISQNTFSKPRPLAPTEALARMYSRLIVAYDEDRTVPIKRASEIFGSANKNYVADALKELGFVKNVPLDRFSFQQFKQIEESLTRRSELDEVFATLGKNGSKGTITVQEFRQFLIDKQRDPRLNEILDPEPSIQECQSLIDKYDNGNTTKGTLTLDGFRAYLNSQDNEVFVPSHHGVYQEMNRPLSHYFVNSSHNSYLIGVQVGGNSSVEIYRQCLLGGCRCVEIDCWDDSDGDIEVTHGNAFCTKVPFKKVVEALRDFSFVNSQFPVIISIENHCGQSQMLKMANYFKTILGDLLCSEYLEGDGPWTLPNNLPPPEKLLRKIILKNKKLSEKQEAVVEAVEVVIDGEIIKEDEEEVKHRQQRTVTVVKELSDLINYVIPTTFRGFENSKKENNCYKMSSFGEKKGAKYAATAPQDFIEYNKLQLSRIYPHGTRVASSNYNPQLFWNVGCQLVALNFQTNSTPLQLNTGKFACNGNIGYILKPECMLKPITPGSKAFDPFTEEQIDDTIAISMKVQVISAQHLGKRDATPAVEIQMFGLPIDTSRPWKTKPCRNKGFNFRWETDNIKEFKQVILPDLALLQFVVVDYSDNKREMGYEVLALNSIRPGYRHIMLKGAKNPLASLFVNIQIAVYVPEEHADFMDRLQNPTKFASMSAKRMKQMEALIEEDEKADPASAALPSVASTTTLSTVNSTIDVNLSRADSLFPTTPGSAPLDFDEILSPQLEKPAFLGFASSSSPGSQARLQVQAPTPVSASQAFQRHITTAMQSAHHFSKTTYYRPTFCDYCSKLLMGVYHQGEQCLDCKINYHNACIPNAPATCEKPRTKEVESKLVASMRAKHAKDVKAMVSENEKKTSKLCKDFERDVRETIKNGQKSLTVLRKKKGVEVSELDAVRVDVFKQLIAFERNFVTCYIDATLESLPALHDLQIQQHEELSKLISAEMSADHSIELMRFDKTLTAQAKNTMLELKKSSSKDVLGNAVKLSKQDLERMKDEQERKLVNVASAHKRELAAQQTENLVKLEKKLDDQETEMKRSHIAEIGLLKQSRIDCIEATDRALALGHDHADAIPWEKDGSGNAYIQALKGLGRVPPEAFP